MVVGFLKKIFGGDGAEGEPGDDGSRAATGQPDVEGFVTFVVRSLVDNPDSVRVQATDSDQNISLQVACDKKDIGKVIGRKGQTIGAIRALANGAAGRLGKKVSVEVLD